VCLTPDNIDSPWIHFEAGALSRALESAKLCPLLFGMDPTDLTGRLSVATGSLAPRLDAALGRMPRAMRRSDAVIRDHLSKTPDRGRLDPCGISGNGLSFARRRCSDFFPASRHFSEQYTPIDLPGTSGVPHHLHRGGS
jgi:hypothetical protein